MSAPLYQIHDDEGHLDLQARSVVEQAVAAAAQRTGVEFIVLVVTSVPGRAFREHAIEQRRKLSAHRDSSLLLVLAVGDRHVELATSPKHNALFTPSLSQRLLVKESVPLLRQHRWGDGIVAAVNACAGLLSGEVKPSAYGGTAQGNPKVFFAVLGSIGLIIASIFGFQYHRNHTCRGCGTWGNYEAYVVTAATSYSEGVKEHSFHCPNCKTNYNWTTTISRSSDDNNSSSGSAGGGSDGGGGADF